MKRLKIAVFALKILIALCGIGFLVAWLVDGTTWHKPLSYLVTIFLPFLPDLLKFFKVRVSDQLALAYEVFLIIAMVFGIDFDMYAWAIVTEDASYFDKLVHFLSGGLAAFAGKELLDNFYDGITKREPKGKVTLRKKSPLFAFIFMLSFAALSALVWECYEFLYDQIFGGHMQELVFAGVADTMWDLISVFCGGAIAGFFLKGK